MPDNSIEFRLPISNISTHKSVNPHSLVLQNGPNGTVSYDGSDTATINLSQLSVAIANSLSTQSVFDVDLAGDTATPYDGTQDNINVSISGILPTTYGGTGLDSIATDALLLGPASNTTVLQTLAKGNTGQVVGVTSSNDIAYQSLSFVSTYDSLIGQNVALKLGTTEVANFYLTTAQQAIEDSSGNIIQTTYATKTELNQLLSLKDALIFKGTIGDVDEDNAMFADVPLGYVYDDENEEIISAGYEAGWTYKVITAGTYGTYNNTCPGFVCEPGDLIICIADNDSSTNHTAISADWVVVQTNIDGAVVGPTLEEGDEPDKQIAFFDGNTGRVITNSNAIVLNIDVENAIDQLDINKPIVSNATISAPAFLGNATSANYLKLYENYLLTTTLNKAANFVELGAMFHLVATSTTVANKPPITNANILQMNWYDTGNHNSQFAISADSGVNRAWFRANVGATSTSLWREIVSVGTNRNTININKPVYVDANGAIQEISNNNVLIDLGSTSGVNIYQANPEPGIKGTLPVAHGGTGVTTIANIQAGKDSDGNTINTTYLKLSGGTVTGPLILQDDLIISQSAINTVLKNGTYDAAGKELNGTILPARWRFNLDKTPQTGDVYIIPILTTGHSYGVSLSLDNGVHYYPIVLNDTVPLTTEYSVGTLIQIIFEQNGTAYPAYPANGSAVPTLITGGIWRVINFYDINSVDRLRSHQIGSLQTTPAENYGGIGIQGYTLVMMTTDQTWSAIAHASGSTDNNSNYGSQKVAAGANFLINSPILYNATNIYSPPGQTITNDLELYSAARFDLRYNVSGSLSLNAFQPVYLRGILNEDRVTFKIATTDWISQHLPTASDTTHIYIYLGLASSAYEMYLSPNHPIFYHDGTKLKCYGGAGGAGTGTWIGDNAPTDPDYNLWVDTSIDASSNTVLRADAIKMLQFNIPTSAWINETDWNGVADSPYYVAALIYGGSTGTKASTLQSYTANGITADDVVLSFHFTQNRHLIQEDTLEWITENGVLYIKCMQCPSNTVSGYVILGTSMGFMPTITGTQPQSENQNDLDPEEELDGE